MRKPNNQVLSSPSSDPSEVNPSGLQVAQFIYLMLNYLMLNNQNVRRAIDSVTSKAVLILGRFTPDRKVNLNALREELRHCNYLPIRSTSSCLKVATSQKRVPFCGHCAFRR
jgi:hypothetical protein